MSDSSQHGLQPASILCSWNSPGKNTGVGCHALPQGNFPTQGSNPCLMSPALAGGFFTTSTTWEALGTTFKKILTKLVEVMEFQLSSFKSWKMMLWKYALNMPAILENSAVATGLEKVSFHSNTKGRQCQRMLKLLHNCTHLTHTLVK